MALLLKSGKQILRLSSSSAAKSRQQLGIGISCNKFTTSTARPSYQDFYSKYFSADYKHNGDDNSFDLPPISLKRLLSSKLKRKTYYAPPKPTPLPELFEKLIVLAEQSKNYPEDRLPEALDDMRPILHEALYRSSNRSIVRFVYEFARPAASPSSPPVVIDEIIKDIVDKLPAHVIHLFQDMMVDMLLRRFRDGISFNTRDEVESTVITADISCIRKEYLKVFMVKDILMITGTDKAVPPASAELLVLKATIHRVIDLSMRPCCYDEHTSSIIEEDQGRVTKLKIVFPVRSKREVVNKPRVIQLNIPTEGTHQG